MFAELCIICGVPKGNPPIKYFVKEFRILRMIAKFNKTKSFQLANGG